MKKFIVSLCVIVLLVASVVVYSHTTGDTKSVQFIDGTTLKSEVGYFGAGGWTGFLNYAGSYMALGTTNSAVLNILTNNLVRFQFGTNGEQTFLCGTYPERKCEGHSLSKSLSDNVNTNMFALVLAANTSTAIKVKYGIAVTDATDMQHYTGTATCRGTNKAGTFTVSCTDVADGSGTYATAGTLAVTWAITGANPAQITLNSNSSLTPTSTVVYYSYQVLGSQDITVN